MRDARSQREKRGGPSGCRGGGSDARARLPGCAAGALGSRGWRQILPPARVLRKDDVVLDAAVPAAAFVLVHHVVPIIVDIHDVVAVVVALEALIAEAAATAGAPAEA